MQIYIRNIYSLLLILFLSGTFLYAQKDKKYIREGNREFNKNKFSDSEVSYRKAQEEAKKQLKPAFNIGDALYKQKKFKEAAEQFTGLEDESKNKPDKSMIYHNLGNSLLQQSQLKESIEAYKEALRNNPGDLETKYNLAYAQNKLKQQQQQKKKNKKQDNKDKNNKNKQKNKDQQNKNNKDQQKKDQQKQNQNQNKNQKQDQSKQQQAQPGKISKQDAMRILQAMQNDEKKVQAKVKKAKASKAKVKTTINW